MNMITIDQLETGLSRYLDAELIPKFPSGSLYRIVIGTSAAIAVKRTGAIIREYESNPIVKALGIIDDNECIDIETVLQEVKKQMPPEGVKLKMDKLGKLDMTLTESDIEELYKYIIRG